MKTHRQAGFTLIELVITLVVIAIGLLGIAAVQVRASNFQKDSFDRKSAALATLSLAEQMRANPAGYLAGQYVLSWNPGAAVPAIPSCAGAICTTTELSTRDLAKWQSLLTAQIGVVGAVVTAPTSDNVLVTVIWLEPAASGSAADDADAACTSLTLPAGFPATADYHCYSTRVFP